MRPSFYHTPPIKYKNTTYLVNQILEFMCDNYTHFILQQLLIEAGNLMV